MVALVGCGSHGAAMPDVPIADDAAADAAAIDAGLGWDTVTQISNDGSVIVEDVTYHSDGLRIAAHLCRPVAAGAHTTIIYNHGGFMGTAADPALAECTQNAKLGYVWLASEYRGEGGSTGNIEVCLGEVSDVLAMLPIARAQPYVDPAHVWMWGGSHGGCITQRAIQRGAQVRAAFDAFGPTDWTPLYQYWQQQVAAGTNASLYMQLLAVMTQAAGTPAANPAGYDARSPIKFLADEPAGVPLLVAHGTADAIVPIAQSCTLAVAIGLESYHDDGAGTDSTAIPTGCETSGVTWHAGARPRPSWPATRYFVAYDGLGHEIASASAMTMLEDAATFFMAK